MMGNGVGAAGAAVVVSLIGLGCNLNNPPPFDPQSITALERSEAGQVGPARLYPLPTTRYSQRNEDQGTQTPYPPATGPALTRNNVLRVPLQEIVQRAALNSSEVKVAAYDVSINETKIVENEARYDPVIFNNFKYDRQNDRTGGTVIPNPNGNQLSNVLIDVERNNIFTEEFGIKQNMPSGGQVSLSYQTQASDYNPRRFVRNHFYDNQIKLQVQQPLLRDFGYEINYARIYIARNDQRVSMLDFRKALEDQIGEIEKDYWQLYEAQREVEVQEELLARTVDLASLLEKQERGGGQATHIEASQARSDVQTRKSILTQARAKVRDLSADIKRRTNDPDPDFAVASGATLLAADAPVQTLVHFDLQEQIDTAMLNRLELGQQQIRINSAEVAANVARYELLPKLDFVGSTQLQGLSTNFGDAAGDQFSAGHVGFSIGLQLEIPIGNREARAIYQRAILQRQQAIEDYRRLTAQISQDVETAARAVNTQWESLQDARAARFEIEDVLTGLNQLLAGGVALTPERIRLTLDIQERLAEFQRQEVLALAQYNIAIAQLEKAKGTLLRYNNIVLEEMKFPYGTTVAGPSTSPRRHGR
jgi:outer membrane protein TolC